MRCYTLTPHLLFVPRKQNDELDFHELAVVALLEPWRRPFIDLYCMLLVEFVNVRRLGAAGAIMQRIACGNASSMIVTIHTFGRLIGCLASVLPKRLLEW